MLVWVFFLLLRDCSLVNSVQSLSPIISTANSHPVLLSSSLVTGIRSDFQVPLSPLALLLLYIKSEQNKGSLFVDPNYNAKPCTG